MNITEFVDQLKEAIQCDEEQNAYEIFVKAFTANQATSTETLRKKGVLRSSNYEFRHRVLKRIAKFATANAHLPEIKRYYQSLESLLYLAETARSIFKSLKASLQLVDFKSYLVSLDLLFWQERSILPMEERNDYRHFTKEELAESFSEYYFLLLQTHKAPPSNTASLNEKGILSHTYLNNLAEFAKLRYLKEAELLVDCFGYTADRNHTTVTLKAIDPQMEKCIRLGYIISEQQHAVDARDCDDQTAMSLKRFSESMSDKLKDRFIYIENEPISRIVMQFPIIPEAITIFSSSSLFEEELIELSIATKELLINYSSFTEVPFYKSLCLMDIVKLQRWLRFLFLCFTKYLDENNLRGSRLHLRSAIPFSSDTDLLQLFSMLVGKCKATELLELVRWETLSGRRFDIQYQPIVHCNKTNAIPLGIASQSYLLRNVLAFTRFRFDSEDQIDPIGDSLSISLRTATENISRNVAYSFNDEIGEVDLIAAIGDYVFIFECKSSLHPCDPFELRTTFDYIQKAKKQLSKIRRLCKDKKFCEYFSRKIGFEILEDAKLTTCIVTNSRMFFGWRVDGHPIRAIHELCNVIKTGTLSVHAPNPEYDGKRLSGWKGDQFTAEDLKQYIADDSWHRPRVEAMVPISQRTRFRSKVLCKETYALDIQKCFRGLESAFHTITEAAPTPKERQQAF